VRRRDVLALGGLAAGGLAAAGPAGCSSAPLPSVVHPQNPVASYWSRQKRHGQVSFANWPLYIDTGRRTLQEFTAATGIRASYAEVIQEDSSWVSKITPVLRSGQPIGYDVMVITNGFWFSQLLTQGDLIPLDQSLLPNFLRNAAAKFQHRSFDPGNTCSIPWASGTTGIAWNPRFIQAPVTSISELWNPAYQGRVGMLADIQDLGNVGMLKLDIDPETSTPADWRAAAAALTRQRDAGQVRGYYRPQTAAQLTESVNYISAVPAAQPVIAGDAARASGAIRQLLREVAISELVWPSAADYRRLYNYADVSGKLRAVYESIFNPVISA